MEIPGEDVDGSRVVCWTVGERATDFLQHLEKKEQGQASRHLSLISASTLAFCVFNNSGPKIKEGDAVFSHEKRMSDDKSHGNIG